MPKWSLKMDATLISYVQHTEKDIPQLLHVAITLAHMHIRLAQFILETRRITTMLSPPYLTETNTRHPMPIYPTPWMSLAYSHCVWKVSLCVETQM